MQMNRSPESTAGRGKNRNRRDGMAVRSSEESRRQTACPPLPDLKGVASATECTGVMPAMPPEERQNN